MSLAPNIVLATPSFRDFGLLETLLQPLESAGYSSPTPIQMQTIPHLLDGKDVLGTAQTGTGKTAAFALPMLQKIDPSQAIPQILVLTPTRELAIQVAESFEKYGASIRGLRVAAIYGGQSYEVQFRKLSRGCHVIVGTPGRLMDLLSRSSIQLNGLRGVVLDEADEMLRMGFAEDVETILQQVPRERQTALFSATMPDPIRRIASQHLKSPVEINIERENRTAETIRQRYVVAPIQQKQRILERILEVEPIEGVIVFVKTRSTCEPLAEYLAQRGHRTAALHGEVPQKQRERIIDHLRSGELDIVVATDVAARGLDVQRISHVFNYDLPHDLEAYIHRIGRTGRAGRSGEAILFLTPRDQRKLKRIEQATRQTIEPMPFPSNREINKRRIAKFHERIDLALSHKELDSFKSAVEQYRRNHEELSIEQIAAALAVLANGENPLFDKSDFPCTSLAFDTRDDRDRDRPRSEGRFQENRAERGRSRMGRDEMETFRLEVGRIHGVSPGNIVGAIANEIGIDSEYIGRIQIREDHSTVDLPRGLPDDLFRALQRVHVLGQRLNISRWHSRPWQTADRGGGSRDDAGGMGERTRSERNRTKHDPSKKLKKRKPPQAVLGEA